MSKILISEKLLEVEIDSNEVWLLETTDGGLTKASIVMSHAEFRRLAKLFTEAYGDES